MGEVHQSLILPDEYRPYPSKIITDGEGIPLIDLSPITNRDLSNPNDPELAKLVAQVGQACKDWGFFTVINHGVPPEIRHKITEVNRKFFDQSLDEKNKLARGPVNTAGYHNDEHSKDFKDWKEVFDFYVRDAPLMPASYDPDDTEIVPFCSLWPHNMPELREVCLEYAKAMEKLFFNVLELVSLSLGLPAKRLHGYFDEHVGWARLNHYPPCPHPDLILGTGGHKDPSALTVLAQDENIEGLDVQRKSDGAWIRVKPIPNSYVINVGDMLQVWSNDIYESIEHRAATNAKTDRYSIPIFFYPSHYVTMKPLEELVTEENPARYREFNAGKWVNLRMVNNYKKHGFYMRINDYKA